MAVCMVPRCSLSSDPLPYPAQSLCIKGSEDTQARAQGHQDDNKGTLWPWNSFVSSSSPLMIYFRDVISSCTRC